jgi:hypothetical protein
MPLVVQTADQIPGFFFSNVAFTYIHVLLDENLDDEADPAGYERNAEGSTDVSESKQLEQDNHAKARATRTSRQSALRDELRANIWY